MNDLYWLTDEQMATLAPFFPKYYDKPWVDDRQVLSGFFYQSQWVALVRRARSLRCAQDAIQKVGALERERDLCQDDGRSGRRTWRGKDRDDRRDLFEGIPHRDQHRLEKGRRGRLIGGTKGGTNTKLHAICDSLGRPIDLLVSAGQVSDFIGARAILSGLPNVKWPPDRSYDADWFREPFQNKGIRVCIPDRKQFKTPVKYDKLLRTGQSVTGVTKGKASLSHRNVASSARPDHFFHSYS